MACSQLAHDAGPTGVPLLAETIGQNLRRNARLFADSDALVVRQQGVRWSYKEFDKRVDQLARALISIGVEVGDRVAIWSPNRFEWVLVQYATARIGAIMVCVNPAYRSTELEFVLRQSGTRLLFASTRFKTSDYREMCREIRPNCPDVQRTIFFDTDDWDELLEQCTSSSRNELEVRSSALSPTDAINIQYTSGTTGSPKGATLTHRNILNNGRLVGETLHYTEKDRVCIPVPLYHCFGMVMGSLACTSHGACIVLPHESFEPLSVLQTIEAERCTSLYGVPTMFIALLNLPEFDCFELSSLRTGIMAGSPCPAELMEAVISRMHMRETTICYGMTETSPVSTQTAATDPFDKRVRTVGRVHPHAEIRIADPESNCTLLRGAPGEVQTRGYLVMDGYWNEPDRTAAAIDSDGWMHTGDLGIMDNEGYIAITGRIKDLIIRGGENISPREIEDFLHTHPAVADVHIVGMPDTRYGEVVCAFVQLHKGTKLDPHAIREFCIGRIAHFKVPRHILIVDEFPMTVTGKVQKFRLRELAKQLVPIE